MHALSAQEMLAVWERGLEQNPLERALALLEAACPESEPQALAAMSIGQRDARLLTLREWAFGSQITGWAVCRSCSQPMEINFQAADLRQGSGSIEPGEIPLSVAGYELRCRPLNSLDLAACSEVDANEMPQRLFARCLIAASSGGEAISSHQLPDEVAQMAIEHVAKADPQADIAIVISCAACGNSSRESFDVISFFWSEIDAWARRIIREVHMLASAYGWNENEILALSPLRRQFYLEMAGA
jgi:hypothetical protein